MKSTLRILAILTILLIGIAVIATLIIFPSDKVEIDSNFPEIKGLYLGQNPPGNIPERFAPGIIDADLHTVVTFSPDRKEVYWKPMNEDETNEIMFMKLENEKWTHPQTVPFASRFFDSDDPCISPSNKKLFFTTWRPIKWYQIFDSRETIWYVERTEFGWSKAKDVGSEINSMDLHWQLSASENNSLFFASEGDIFQSVFEKGQYHKPMRLDSAVNSDADDGHPYIASDEGYLIFSSNNQVNNVGSYDLYISTKMNNGLWSEAQNLGGNINSEYQDLYPVVSPDEKYLFFVSNRQGMHSVYWVDFEQVKTLIYEAVEGD